MMRNRIFAIALAACLGLGLLAGCSSEKQAEPDFSGVQSVCELASLKCYYHNVAKVNIPGWGPFGWGEKRLWMEYDGIVIYGIDVSQVHIGAPDDQGVVRVSVPEAKVLSVYLDTNSLGEPYDDSGIFPWDQTSIEDKTRAIAQAQTDMQETATSNNALLLQASARAKRTIEGYVKNVGTTVGADYTVEWV